MKSSESYSLGTMKTLRLDRGWTQKQMAEKLCVSRECYANYESGKREMGYRQLAAVADLFGVSIDYLLGHETDSARTFPREEMERFIVWEREQFIRRAKAAQNSLSDS